MSSLLLGRLVVVPGASFYDWLMFGHVLAAGVWLGGWTVLAILAAQALRQADLASLARFAATIRFIGPRLLAPAIILVAGLGVWLLLDSHQWHFSQFWIELAIGLLGAALVVGAGFQSRAAIGAERAIAEDNLDQATRHVRQWAWGSMLILLLLAIATWDMTVKP
jgi:uncharacterized membrane protein